MPGYPRKTDEPARARKNWTPQELKYLSDRYGLVSDEELASQLQRTETSIYLATKKRLHQIKTDNFYPARELAQLLGVRCPKTIVYWVHRGWLKGKRAPYYQGLTRPWIFTEADGVRLLKEHPWLVNLQGMPEHHFRAIVQEEYATNPWYTCKEAAPLLGVKTDDSVQRYIKIKWLLADKKPGGPWQGVWVIRHSAIVAFLKDDPRHNGRPLKTQQLLLSPTVPVSRVCPKCGSRLYPGVDGMECFICGKVVYW